MPLPGEVQGDAHTVVSSPGFEFRMLGPIDVVGSDGQRVVIEGRRGRLALAMLLVNRNQVVSVDALIDGLWPDGPPDHATATLHAYISKLRRAVGGGPLSGVERILRRAPGYQLVTVAGEVDADSLERALALGEAAMRDSQFAVASASLRQGLQLMRGPLLGEFRDEPFALGEVARLEGIRVRALERRVDAELALSRHATVIGELERLVAEHRLHERFYEQLMLALYRGGRQADSLQVYQQAFRVLAEDLGLVPGPGLRAMEAAILAQDPGLDIPAARHSIRPPSGPALLLNAGDAGALVGRKKELAVLREAWERACVGDRQTLIIEGDLGQGATRLAAEIARVAGDAGAALLVGRAAGEALIPYQPFVEALSGYVSGLSAEELQSLSGVGAGFLADIFPGLETGRLRPPHGSEAGAGSHRYLLFEAVATLLDTVAAPSGALLVLDDVHEADPSTVQLLEHITRHRNRSRLLVVATSDAGTSPGGPAVGLWSRLVSDGLAKRLPIAGLAVEEVAELLGEVTGRGGESLPALAAAVHELTEGIPLFVVEVGRGMADLDAGSMFASGDLTVPDRVRATLDRRINQVPAVVVSVLRTASIIGETFDAATVAAVTHQTGDGLAPRLAAAVTAGLIRTDGPGRYRFAHRLLHRTLDSRVGSTERGEVHAELATLLAGPASPFEATAAEVAHHFRLATFHHADQATTYSGRAGDQAMGVLAFEDAEQHYQRALDTLQACESVDPRREGKILLALGRARHAAYRRLGAIASFRHAAQLFVAHHDREGLTAAAWGLMTSTEFSVAEPEVVALFRDALERCDPRDGTLRARLTAGLGRVLPAGDAEGARLAAEAVTMARAIGDPETAAIALSAAVLTCWAPDNLAWRQQTTDEVLALAERLGWVDTVPQAVLLWAGGHAAGRARDIARPL
jgi:DNA-binding SARP family transcriptional activator